MIIFYHGDLIIYKYVMKIKLFFRISFLFVTMYCEAQVSEELTGYVYCDETRLPIQYATIELVDNNSGALTNKQGYFSIVLTEKNRKGLINIRLLGYKPISEDLNKFIKNKVDTIYLIRDTIDLTEITISSQQINCPKEILGVSEKNNSAFCENVGNQIAVFCKNVNDNKKGKINSLSFYIKSGGKYNAPFRVRLYDVDENGLPGKELLKENLIVAANKKKWFEIDIDSLNITIPKTGFFIAMEWIYTDESFHYLSEANRKKYSRQQYGQILGAVESKELNDYTYLKRLGGKWYKFIIPYLQKESISCNALINAKVTYSCQE